MASWTEFERQRTERWLDCCKRLWRLTRRLRHEERVIKNRTTHQRSSWRLRVKQLAHMCRTLGETSR